MCITSFVPFCLMWAEKVSGFVIGNKITVLWLTFEIFSQCCKILLGLSIYPFGWFRFAYFRFFIYNEFELISVAAVVIVFDWYKYERSFEVINYRFCSSIIKILEQSTIRHYYVYSIQYTHIQSHYTSYFQHLIMFITFWFSINSSRYTTIDSGTIIVHIFKFIFSRYYLPCSFLNCFVVRSIILLLYLIVHARWSTANIGQCW